MALEWRNTMLEVLAWTLPQRPEILNDLKSEGKAISHRWEKPIASHSNRKSEKLKINHEECWECFFFFSPFVSDTRRMILCLFVLRLHRESRKRRRSSTLAKDLCLNLRGRISPREGECDVMMKLASDRDNDTKKAGIWLRSIGRCLDCAIGRFNWPKP